MFIFLFKDALAAVTAGPHTSFSQARAGKHGDLICVPPFRSNPGLDYTMAGWKAQKKSHARTSLAGLAFQVESGIIALERLETVSHNAGHPMKGALL